MEIIYLNWMIIKTLHFKTSGKWLEQLWEESVELQIFIFEKKNPFQKLENE